ncbi:MAG: oxidoreductase [Rhodobacteraceae bacterium]|nr:MAG: oxidoreductase [Paracoccaceae bacterium]
MRLKEKSAVVTGGGRGIGRQIALMYAQQGARVLACDINPKALAELQEFAQGEGLDISICACDLTDPKGAQKLADMAQDLFGEVHILVNAAAIVVMGWIEDLSVEDWHITLRGEIDTVFLVTRAIWPLLKKSGGSVVNFASANAHVALKGLPALAHTAGKGAVLAMTRQLAMEGGPVNIRANTIAPGFVLTEETSQHLDNDGLMSQVHEKLMLDRLGTTSDIGWLAIYLGSDESGYVTGSDFSIDGGCTAW